jgi:uncharacterized alkaline shock family protein YloU
LNGHAAISHELLASYAADAALEVDGVRGLVDAPRRHRGVRVKEENGAIGLEIHLELKWGTSAPIVGSAVQARVSTYVSRTTNLTSVGVDVVVQDVSNAEDQLR